MKKFLFALPFILIVFIACKTAVKGKNGVEYKDAVQYNDYIVKKQTEVVKLIMQFGQESQTDVIKAGHTIDKAISTVDQDITDLEGMPEWKGNTALRDNAAALFKFYKSIFSTDYKRMLAMKEDGTISTEEETEYNQMMQKITDSEGKLDASFKTSQTEFASKNGFKIMANEMQKEIDKAKN